jgi:hypothetical protein
MTDEIGSRDIERFVVKYRVSSINTDDNFTYETINSSYNSMSINRLREIGYTVTLPLSELNRLVEMDKSLSLPRNTHPAIREAYEQYLILRKLYE